MQKDVNLDHISYITSYEILKISLSEELRGDKLCSRSTIVNKKKERDYIFKNIYARKSTLEINYHCILIIGL